MSTDKSTKLSVFNGKHIFKILHDGEWCFSIIDVIEVLVGGDRPRKYWNDLKNNPVCTVDWNVTARTGELFLKSPDRKMRLTDCANTETMFCIIQSIPSPKVEPLKRWLARVCREHIDEIENPDLAMVRMQELYENKGYPKEWIDKCLRGIAVLQDLTDEWKNRGFSTSLEYDILTKQIK